MAVTLMASFATVEQYEARYGTVTDVDALQECLDDASALIAASLDARGIGYADPSDEYADRLMRVCRQVAHRAMNAAPADGLAPYGVTQASQSAGGYSLSYSFGNPYGDSFLTASEKRLLGLAGTYVYSVEPRIAPRIGRGGR